MAMTKQQKHMVEKVCFPNMETALANLVNATAALKRSPTSKTIRARQKECYSKLAAAQWELDTQLDSNPE